jgi:hypothetical protein
MPKPPTGNHGFVHCARAGSANAIATATAIADPTRTQGPVREDGMAKAVLARPVRPHVATTVRGLPGVDAWSHVATA